jgi:hypothetical protein
MTALTFRSRQRQVAELKNACNTIATTPKGDTRALASHLNKMILAYYEDVRRQAQQSFHSAVAMGTVGAALFFFGCYEAMRQGPGQSAASFTPAAIAVIGGALVQTLSGLQFFIYGRAARQFQSFHICLERMNRFLLANTIVESLTHEPAQEKARLELMHQIVTAPMLVLDDAGAAVPEKPAARAVAAVA